MAITIWTTALSFRVKVNHKAEIINTPLSIIDFTRKLTQWQWDNKTRRQVLGYEFFKYDAKQELCYLPRFELDDFKIFLERRGVNYTLVDLAGEEGRHINFLMLPFVGFKNDAQKGCVEFVDNPKSGPLRGVALQTGKGKTVAVIMGIQRLHRRSMIAMTSRLEQWVSEIKKYTTLEDDDIYVIQGVGSLTKLFTLIDQDLKPKIILASSKTLRNYIDYAPNYQHLPHPSEMCEKLGIGVVGTDEYHEHFYTNFLVGLVLNPAIHIPITATFTTSDQYIKKIFDRFIPKEIQFAGGAYDKYVEVYAYSYNGGSYLLKPYTYKGAMGYSQQVFEKWLMGRGRKFLDSLVHDAIIPIVREHYINIAQKGQKFLFLCSSRALCDHLEGIFRRSFNSKTVSVFYAGMPTTVLERYDMILSTPGSAGTGRDIKNLRTCFVFESVEAETRNLQFIGRLRKLPEGEGNPVFTYVYLPAIPSHNRVANARSLLYGPRSIKFVNRSI